jgi:hypothetical protein
MTLLNANANLAVKTADANHTLPDYDLGQLKAVRRHIRASDGMPVTAQVWEEAHNFHLRLQQLHLRCGHRAGILMGLKVVASNEPDTVVTIYPGAAIDGQGNLYVLTEAVAYDVSSVSEGWLRIVLVADNKDVAEQDATGAAYDMQGFTMLHLLHDRFDKKAVIGDVHEPHVEVARVRRVARGKAIEEGKEKEVVLPIANAKNATSPQTNEIDLRFRSWVGPAPKPVVSIGVVHLGGPTQATRTSARGVSELARALTHSGRYQAVVDEEASVDSALEGYTLIVALGADMNTNESTALNQYLKSGGLVLADCPPAALNTLRQRFAGFNSGQGGAGETVEDLPTTHRLLHTPHLFTAAPPGVQGPNLLAGAGLVLCAADYGRAWLGQRLNGPATREDIRSAHEFGENIIAYALAGVGERSRAHDAL